MGLSPSVSEPPVPKLFPVDITKTENLGVATDVRGYNLADADFARRFPGLVQIRQADIMNTSQNLGHLPRAVEGEFVNKGLAQSMSAFGGGSEGGGIARGIGRNTIATSLANQTQDYQDQQRNYFDQLLQGNPQRAFGLSGGDAANLAIANTGNLSAANQQAAAAANTVKNAQNAADAQGTAAAAGIAASVLASVISAL